MYHSITFYTDLEGEGINTWDDWRLIPSSRPVFNPPSVKEKILDIPGSSGVLDLSQSLTGYPVYGNRDGSFEFYVTNDFKTWEQAFSDIMNVLHGQHMLAVLEDDLDYYYEGSFKVNEWRSEKDWSRIVIDYSVGPYKWSRRTSIDSWLWDPFNFNTGVITSAMYKNLIVSSEEETIVSFPLAVVGNAPMCPIFIVESSEETAEDLNGVEARFKNPRLGIDVMATLPEGASKAGEFIVYGGESTVTLRCKRKTGGGGT